MKKYIHKKKGGVGKTTTALNLTVGLARNGHAVLAVDFDPQDDLTASLGWKDNDSLENTISTMLESPINDSPIDSPKRKHPVQLFNTCKLFVAARKN